MASGSINTLHPQFHFHYNASSLTSAKQEIPVGSESDGIYLSPGFSPQLLLTVKVMVPESETREVPSRSATTIPTPIGKWVAEVLT